MNTKLDKKTKLAMGDSLVMWLRISRSRQDDQGVLNRPLCKLFYKVDCEGCPIKEKTNRTKCLSTPYDHWVKHHEFEHPVETRKFGFKVYCSECKEIARDMFDFYLDMLFEG